MASSMYVNDECIIRRAVRVSSDMMLSPDARPSIPSMRFIALVIYMIMNIEAAMPSHAGTSSMPKSPANECIYVPESTMRTAAMVCMTNLYLYPSPTRSSTSPVR